MSYLNVVWHARKWFFWCMCPVVLFFSWSMVVKPYEIKRLQREAAQTAERLSVNFQVEAAAELASIGMIFASAERDYYEPGPAFMEHLYLHFKRMKGFESFTLSSENSDASFVLVNPYVKPADNAIGKEQCDRILQEHPEWEQAYGSLTVIPVEQSLCVYGPKRHMLAVLNLNIMLDVQLKQEMMDGYFLALPETQVNMDTEFFDGVIASWAPSWVHRKALDFLGTHRDIKIYPSKAYVEASVKRVFLVFCLTFLGGVGLLGWWFLRRYVQAYGSDSHYVKHLKQLALFDGVTNLPNRRHCMDHLNRVLNHAKHLHTGFSVCFMDCNDFKGINDTYGHHVGDVVLRHIADEVSLVMRENDFFARFSGDEFCLVLEDAVTDASIQVALNKILDVISQPVFVGEATIVVGMSVGVAVYPDGGNNVDTLLKHADLAMYDAKRHQERYIIHHPEVPF